MPETEQKRPVQNRPQQPRQTEKPQQSQKKKPGKKKKPSRLAHILSIVGMCAGLFALVSLLTFAAIGLKQRKEQRGMAEDGDLEILEPVRSFEHTAATTTAAVLITTETGTGETTDLTTDSTTGDTTETTTVSTRYIPDEDEYPYFTRKYTYPHEAELTETLSRRTSATTTTTTTAAAHDPASLLYVSYGAALKQFLLNAGEDDTEPMYALTDLNGDGIPELIISGGTAQNARYAVYAFSENQAVELQSESGGTFGHLYLHQDSEQEPPVLIEICESEGKTDTYYYQFDGTALTLLHSFSDYNGNYFADGSPVSVEEYAALMNLSAQQNAGRETALPADAEALTEVGGHSL